MLFYLDITQGLNKSIHRLCIQLCLLNSALLTVTHLSKLPKEFLRQFFLFFLLLFIMPKIHTCNFFRKDFSLYFGVPDKHCQLHISVPSNSILKVSALSQKKAASSNNEQLLGIQKESEIWVSVTPK